MPRLHHQRATDSPAETPDWAWTQDADMPSAEEIERQALRDAYAHGRRATDHPVDRQHPLPLSPQQHDVLVCLSHGLREAGTADKLGLTRSQVHGSGEQIRRKLDARNEAHAVAIAIRSGLIE